MLQYAASGNDMNCFNWVQSILNQTDLYSDIVYRKFEEISTRIGILLDTIWSIIDSSNDPYFVAQIFKVLAGNDGMEGPIKIYNRFKRDENFRKFVNDFLLSKLPINRCLDKWIVENYEK